MFQLEFVMKYRVDFFPPILIQTFLFWGRETVPKIELLRDLIQISDSLKKVLVFAKNVDYCPYSNFFPAFHSPNSFC